MTPSQLADYIVPGRTRRLEQQRKMVDKVGRLRLQFGAVASDRGQGGFDAAHAEIARARQ